MSEEMIRNTALASGIGGVSCAAMGLFLEVGGVALVSTAAAVGVVGLMVIASMAATLSVVCCAALLLGKCRYISFSQIENGKALAKLCLSAFVPVAVVMTGAVALSIFALSSLPAVAGAAIYICSHAVGFFLSGLIVKGMINCCFPKVYEQL